MIIGIDGNEANVEKKVGISEYAYELLLQFHTLQIANCEFRIYLKEQPRIDMPQERPNWSYVIVKPKKLWTQIGLPLYLFTHFPRPNVFFSPTHYAPRFSPILTVISIMDLSFLHFPHLFAKKDLYQLTEWTKYSVRNARKVFTISQASKNDILETYHLRSENVIVTYPGIKQEKNMKQQVSKKDVQKKFGTGENYILFVGTLQPRKNIERLIEAFASVKKHTSKIKDLALIIVGKKGWLYENILAAPKKFGVADSVKFLEYVNDSDLSSLYAYALVYVLPSLYEGFGLPVIEAMKYGCPVITSNVSSLPEAGGNAALYIDPLSIPDIAEKIEKVIENPKLREDMIQRGYRHIKKFSWEKAAKETIDVLTNLAS